MRTARIIQPGVFYHVTSRVNHKEMLLRSLVAKKLFLEQLIRLRLRHTCENLDFVVMENHVHLILRPVGEATLSGVMKFLLGVYTMGFNRIYGTWGRFWGARYFSRPINGLGDLAATMAYVDNNPVRAGLVARAEDWPWGGLAIHRNGQSHVIGPAPFWVRLLMQSHACLALGWAVRTATASAVSLPRTG